MPVKVSWDFAMLQECPGHKAFSKAGIQGFYSCASKNFTGVILDIWGIAAVILDSSHTDSRRHSATAFGNTPQLRPYRSAGEQVTQYSQLSPSHSHIGPRHSVSKRRNLEQWLKKSTAEYPFPAPHGLNLGLYGENSRVAAIIGSYPAILHL